MTAFPGELRHFVDDEGRLKQWPVKHKLQMLALPALACAIPLGRKLAEREINELLNARHTFGDPALLRRLLVDHGYLDRRPDGSAYWRIQRPAGSL